MSREEIAEGIKNCNATVDRDNHSASPRQHQSEEELMMKDSKNEGQSGGGSAQEKIADGAEYIVNDTAASNLAAESHHPGSQNSPDPLLKAPTAISVAAGGATKNESSITEIAHTASSSIHLTAAICKDDAIKMEGSSPFSSCSSQKQERGRTNGGTSDMIASEKNAAAPPPLKNKVPSSGGEPKKMSGVDTEASVAKDNHWQSERSSDDEDEKARNDVLPSCSHEEEEPPPATRHDHEAPLDHAVKGSDSSFTVAVEDRLLSTAALANGEQQTQDAYDRAAAAATNDHAEEEPQASGVESRREAALPAQKRPPPSCSPPQELAGRDGESENNKNIQKDEESAMSSSLVGNVSAMSSPRATYNAPGDSVSAGPTRSAGSDCNDDRAGTQGVTSRKEEDSLFVLQSAASLLALGIDSREKKKKSAMNAGVRSPKGDVNIRSTSSPAPSSSSSNNSSSLSSEKSQNNNQPTTIPSNDKRDVVVDEPAQSDILCGRGRGFFCHPGNRRMLVIVQSNKPRYRAANKTRKTEIVRDATDEIEMGGSRFLKRHNNAWFEVSAAEKHKKVCHCLREEKNNTDSPPASSSEHGLESAVLATSTGTTKSNEQSDSMRAKKGDSKKRGLAKISHSRFVSEMNALGERSPLIAPNLSKKNRTRSISISSENYMESKGPTTTDNLVHVESAQRAGGKVGYSRETPPSSDTSWLNERPLTVVKRSELDILGMAATLQMRKDSDRIWASSGVVGGGDPPRHNNGLRRSTNEVVADAANSSAAAGLVYQSQYPTTEFGSIASARFYAHEANLDEKYGIVMGDPKPSDVLFGQDPSFYSHPGNIHLRRLIQGSIGYPAINAQSKLVLAQRIVADMKYTGTRFLTRQRASVQGLWYRIEDIEAETLILRCLEEEEANIISVISGGRESSAGAVHGLVDANLEKSSSLSTRAQGPPTGERIQPGRGTEFTTINGENQSRLAPVTTIPSTTVYGSAPNRPSAGHNQIPPTMSSKPDYERPSPLSSDEGSEDEGGGIIDGLPSPGPYDVICGRGRGNFRHPGNRRMLRMFWNVKAKYNQGTKLEKTMIGRAIVQDITTKGGRFLKRSGNRWEEVEKKAVLRKVCHGIRDIPNDPAKRKRSIVADELDDPQYEDDYSTNELSSKKKRKKQKISAHKQTEAPWLASRAKTTNLANNEPSSRGPVDKEEEDTDTPLISLKRQKKKASKERDGISTKMSSTCQADKSLVAGQGESYVDLVEIPSVDDILMGKGNAIKQHPGNQRMLHIIRGNAARYTAAPSKAQKRKIVDDVLDLIQTDGARFLKRIKAGKEAGSWTIISYPEALEKAKREIIDHISRIERTGEYLNTAVSPSHGAMRATAPARSPTGQHHGSNRNDRELSMARGQGVLESHAAAVGFAPAPGWSGTSIVSGHSSAGSVGGMPLHLILAARQQAEAQAASIGSGGSRQLTPQEHLYLLQHGGGAQLTQADLMVLREQERQMSFRRFL